MRRFSFFAFILFFGASLATCSARLGDTEAECVARYGAESGVRDNLGFDVVGDKSVTFRPQSAQGSLVLNIVFLNGRAAHESITKGGADGFSVAQKQALFDEERANFGWTRKGATSRTDPLDNTVGIETWVRADGATAQCWTSGKAGIQVVGEIDFSTQQYAAAQGKLDKEDGSG